MARIAGVNIPDNKHCVMSLTHIYGVGRSRAQVICQAVGIDGSRKVSDLNETELVRLRAEIKNYTLEGDLRREVAMNIKRLIDLATYRGICHRHRLPVRGQRTRTNARTRKGAKKLVKK